KNIKFTPLEKVGKASYNIFLTQMVYYCYLYRKIKEFNTNPKKLEAYQPPANCPCVMHRK
ncbi:MAG: hypothetical protein SO116_01875, partial [Treponema sp.]|nr:hypothetical protein [Treponema sp.]